MVIMKLRGGDLDLVEYHFRTFAPGENIRVPFEGACDLHPYDGTVRVRAPSRIHLTVMDMNRFAPERPGGGGLGFAIALPTTVRGPLHRRPRRDPVRP